MQVRQHGFSLVEIAIVLVIIGLLLGGVLKGQEMITQGKIRSIEKELDGTAIAILGYQERYKALPGDDDKATTRWSSSANGNINGRIDGDFNSTTNTDESRILWQHLRLAGFINGAAGSSTQATNAVGGIIGVQSDLRNGTVNLLSGTIICSTNLPAKIANAIDAQVDDGQPNKGSLRGFVQTASNTPDFTSAGSAYSDDGHTLFTICRSI